MEAPVEIFARFSKLVHALSQASGQIWQLLRAEENKHDKKDDKYVRATEFLKPSASTFTTLLTQQAPWIIPRKQ